MLGLLDLMPLSVLLLAITVICFGGFVKGAVGFALPLIMMSGMGAFMAPELALAGLIIPATLTNMWQGLRQGLGPALASLSRHLHYLTITLGVVVVVAQIVPAVPQQVFLLVIGLPITAYAITQLLGWQLRVSEARRGVASWLFGLIAGVLGGFSSAFGPPTVAYLITISAEKSEQVRFQGMVYFLGNVVLLASHLRSGVLNAQTLPFSLLLVLPAALGMWLGFALQDRMNRAQFLRATLLVLLIAGLNLIRRAIWG